MQLEGINDYLICWGISVSLLDCSFSICHELRRGISAIFSAISLCSRGCRCIERAVCGWIGKELTFPCVYHSHLSAMVLIFRKVRVTFFPLCCCKKCDQKWLFRSKVFLNFRNPQSFSSLCPSRGYFLFGATSAEYVSVLCVSCNGFARQK